MPHAPKFLAYVAAVLIVLGWTEPWAADTRSTAPPAVILALGDADLSYPALPDSDRVDLIGSEEAINGSQATTDFRTLVATRLRECEGAASRLMGGPGPEESQALR